MTALLSALTTMPPQGPSPARMSGSPIPVRPDSRQETPKENTCQTGERNRDRSTELNTFCVHPADREADGGVS